MPQINTDRLLSDLHELRNFGRQDPGVVRLSLSEVDMAARYWLREKMQQAGLDACIDGVGNVFGRSRNPGKALLLGSHSDTQPTGGWLDGALGVIYALEAARACAEDPATRELAIDTIAWIDEEGTYLSCLGSRSFCGNLRAAEIDAAHNGDGHPLRDALHAVGLDGVGVQAEADRYAGYLEGHIEQGGYLEHAGLRIGVVTAIVGMRNFAVSFSGQQNHAGTTPMPLRKDAGRALIDYAYRVNREFEQLADARTVWTIGRINVLPGSTSVIPGQASLNLQIRDADEACMDRLEAKARELAEQANTDGPVRVHFERASKPMPPMPMDAELQRHLTAAAKQHAPEQWQAMPSAAIHDAMYLAGIMPAGMLFVPSIGGISHDFSEDTAEADLALGGQILTTAAASILQTG